MGLCLSSADEAPGVLKRHSQQVKNLLYRSYGRKDVYELSSSSIVVGNLRISLLSTEDGKEHMAKVAGGMAKAVHSAFVSKEEVDVDFVQEKLFCASKATRLCHVDC
jgi:hypothetical protein